MELSEILPQVRIDKPTKIKLQKDAKAESRSLSSHIRHVLKLSVSAQK